MSCHKSFSKAVADWIDNNQWPRDSEVAQSIVVVTKKNSIGTIFGFQSGFGHLQIDGIYIKDVSLLVGVQIKVVAPGHHKAVTLAEAPCYYVSPAAGVPILFDLDNGYIKGSVSFKYRPRSGQRDIFATYDVHLPYAEDQKGTIDIGPTEVTEAAGFTAAQLTEIALFTPLELEVVGEKATVPFKLGQIRTLNGVNEEELAGEQALLINFLKDFVVDQDSIIIETYYPSSGGGQTLTDVSGNNSSKQWHATISFLAVLELVASVDPEKLSVSAALQVRLPIIGRVHLVEIQGSLVTGAKADINLLVAKGNTTFSTSKNGKGKYELYIDGELNIKHIHTIKTNGKRSIATLPF